jgi:hypothetical protein
MYGNMLPEKPVSPNLNVVLVEGALGGHLNPHDSFDKPKVKGLVTAATDSNGMLHIDAATLRPAGMSSQIAL